MKAVKFNFGDDFDAQTQTQEELDAKALEVRLRQTQETAFAEGFTSGKTEASEAIAKELVVAMEGLADQVNTLFAQQAKLQDRVERDAVQLAIAMARKLAATALEMNPHAEIEALIAECMEASREQPKIVIRLSGQQCEPIAAKMEELKGKNGFTGDVIVIGDEDIQDGDCLVEWPDGGAERRSAQISQAIEKLVQAFVMKPPATGQIEPEAKVEAEVKAGEPTEDQIHDENKSEAPEDTAPEAEQPGAL
jgi:flagellar assembly protein FliH